MAAFSKHSSEKTQISEKFHVIRGMTEQLQKEIKELNKLYENNSAELVAIFGRRRVGKTYLVDEVFSDRITN